MGEEEINAPQPSTSAISVSASDHDRTSVPPVLNKTSEPKKINKPKAFRRSGDHEFGYNTTMPFAPWRRKRYSLSIGGLHEEIMDFYEWIRPNKMELLIRDTVYKKVYNSIMKRWKNENVTVSMFGSLKTSLFLPSSDIDVLVECPEWCTTDGSEPTWLRETAEALVADNVCHSVSVYSGAHVPIVKMVEKDTRLSIDISFNTVQGVRAAEYIEKVKKEFPIITPLVLLLKQFLHYRRLNQTFTGGLSSYGLILMVVNFLQMNALPLRHKSIDDDSVNFGELLLRFFEVYSCEFNYEQIGICISQVRYVPKCEPGMTGYGLNRSHPGNLFLEDPMLLSNDVGRSTYNFSAISIAFGQALQILMVSITVRDRRSSSDFQKIYRGSMLHLIMPVTSKELIFRNWLKGGVLMYPYQDRSYDHKVTTSTLLAPSVDLSQFDWMRYAGTGTDKISKVLKIEVPADKLKEMEEEEERREIEKKKEQQSVGYLKNTSTETETSVEKVKKVEEDINDASNIGKFEVQDKIEEKEEKEVEVEEPVVKNELKSVNENAIPINNNNNKKRDSSDEDEMIAPPMPISTASVTTSATMSTTASEREDNDSPLPFDESALNTEKSETEQTKLKKFSEVVKSSEMPKTTQTNFERNKDDCNMNGNRKNTFMDNYASVAQNGLKNRAQRSRGRGNSRNYSPDSNDGFIYGCESSKNKFKDVHNSRRGRESSHSNRSKSERLTNNGHINGNSCNNGNYVNGASFDVTTSENSKALENGNNIKGGMVSNSTSVTATIANPKSYAETVKNKLENVSNRAANVMVSAAITVPVVNGNSPRKGNGAETTPTSYLNVAAANLNTKVSRHQNEKIDGYDSKSILNSPTIDFSIINFKR